MSKPGHNSGKGGPISAERLKSFIERIERMEEERKAIAGDIRDIYAEAKGVGYDVKTVRWVVQERRLDASARAERDALRDVYHHALDTAVGLVRGGLSLREAGRITGASKSSIHRALAVPSVSQPQDGDDGITECTAGPAEGAVDQQIAAQQDPQAVRIQPTATPDPEGREGTGTHSNEAPATPSVGAVASESERVAPNRALPCAATWGRITAAREAHEAATEAERERKREARRQENERASRLAALTDADMPDQPPFLRGRGA